MAYLTAQSISRLAVTLLVRQLVLPRTVAMVPGTEFTGDNGDTITVRVRQPRTAKTQTTPGQAITFDPVNETSVDLTVAHLYDAVRVTDEQLTLEIADFGSQVLAPMLASVAIGAENQIAAVMNDLAPDVTSVTDANVEDSILDVRQTLGEADAPLGDRWLAVSPGFAKLLLGLENLSDVSAAGSPSALRDAVIGRYRGFTVVESNGLEAGSAVAYHSSGFTWGNRAPAAPRGANDVQIVNEQGVALRIVFDFDASILSDIVAVSTFAGAAAVYEDQAGTVSDRFVKLTTEGA